MIAFAHTHTVVVVVAASRTINEALPVGRATQFPISLSLLRSTFGHSKYIFNCSNFFLLFFCCLQFPPKERGWREEGGQEVYSIKHAAFKFTQSAAAQGIVHRHFIIK